MNLFPKSMLLFDKFISNGLQIKLDAVIKTIIPARKCFPLNMRHPVTKWQKSGSIEPKKNECQLILYFTFCLCLHSLKYDLQGRVQSPPKKSIDRSIDRSREREGGGLRSSIGKGCRSNGNNLATVLSKHVWVYFVPTFHIY